MNTNDKPPFKTRLKRFIYFFPFQLFIAHLKKNLILIGLWVALFALITYNLGKGFGIPYLLLSPEYLGEISFISHLILGFSLGGFIMAFNISSYILNSYSFSFIATLSRPFLKYCFNNFILPISFSLVYLYQLIDFQIQNDYLTTHIILNTTGFVFGLVLFIVLSLSYFFSTNRSVFEILKLKEKDKPERQEQNLVRGFFYRFDSFSSQEIKKHEFNVETYLVHPFKIGLARESDHYEDETLKMVFSQNHINASLFEAFVIITIIILGLFRDNDLFQIPAGASIFIMLSMILMAFSALYSWLRGWSTFVLIGLIISLTYITGDNSDSLTKASGISYENHHPAYTAENLLKLTHDSIQIKNDITHHLSILENWKKKNQSLQQKEKPILVFLNSSGGGLRSTLWNYHCISVLDSIFERNFLDYVHLMSGSSGGMLGSAYARTLHLKRKKGKNIHLYAKKYYENISNDLLNAIGFTIVVHDLYFNFSRSIKDDQILKDRAFAFEKRFNHNTQQALSVPIKDYSQPEFESKIPLMILSPTILNDNRKLYISPQPSRFLSALHAENLHNTNAIDRIEYTALFKHNNPLDLSMTSALRMNATFPYILPNTSLPTEPEIKVFDAGWRDNFGLETSVDYASHFKEWLNENTSGILVIQIRDLFKRQDDFSKAPKNYEQQANSLTPIGNAVSTHNYHQDQLLSQLSMWYAHPLNVQTIELENPKEDQISLSWHLTKKEKKRILSSIKIDKNKASLDQIKNILSD